MNGKICFKQWYFILSTLCNGKKRIVLLELSRIICIIADNYNNDPLLSPRTLTTTEMHLTAGLPQG